MGRILSIANFGKNIPTWFRAAATAASLAAKLSGKPNLLSSGASILSAGTLLISNPWILTLCTHTLRTVFTASSFFLTTSFNYGISPVAKFCVNVVATSANTAHHMVVVYPKAAALVGVGAVTLFAANLIIAGTINPIGFLKPSVFDMANAHFHSGTHNLSWWRALRYNWFQIEHAGITGGVNSYLDTAAHPASSITPQIAPQNIENFRQLDQLMSTTSEAGNTALFFLIAGFIILAVAGAIIYTRFCQAEVVPRAFSSAWIDYIKELPAEQLLISAEAVKFIEIVSNGGS